jgi:hypothetical protein
MIPHTDQRSIWTFEKNISLTFLLTIITQIFAGIWWISTLSVRVHDLEKTIEQTKNIPLVLYRLEERVEHLKTNLDRLLKRIELNAR